jgi:shikimate kinase
MNYLSSIGTIVYLKIHLATLLRRVKNKHARGLSKLPGKSLQELYHERLPLYERWAEITLSNDWPLTAWQMDRLMGQLEGQI